MEINRAKQWELDGSVKNLGQRDPIMRVKPKLDGAGQKADLDGGQEHG